MASNYTENYGLCQWEATDKVGHTEFNEDNAKIDAALGTLATQTATLATKGNCRIDAFTYTGKGAYGEENPTCISFSGKPVLFVVFGYAFLAYGHYGDAEYHGFCRNPKSNNTDITVLTPKWEGTMLSLSCPYSIEHQGNVAGRVYRVVALYAMDE